MTRARMWSAAAIAALWLAGCHSTERSPATERRAATEAAPPASTWRAPGRPVLWSLGPARLPAGVARGSVEGEYVNEQDGSVLVYVPPGTFDMGSQSGDRDEAPVDEVRFTRGYFLGKHEVTWAQYRAFCRATGHELPSSAAGSDFEAPDTHPVFNVSWDDAQAYGQWAGLRLPTEAEWEYAARGGDGRIHPWGDVDPGTTRCNLKGDADGFAVTSPVGSFAAGASAFGALDMAGNVAEWVQDWYDEPYPGARTDPTGPASGTQRVLRGGPWDTDLTAYFRATDREECPPGVRSKSVGFRICRSSDE
jgi:formylglycine-generating enzyme required for sulfatase activity